MRTIYADWLLLALLHILELRRGFLTPLIRAGKGIIWQCEVSSYA
jgi:hypothetical protein